MLWECIGSRVVGRLRKKWIDSVNECFIKKERLECSGMVHDRNDWQGFVLGNPWS